MDEAIEAFKLIFYILLAQKTPIFLLLGTTDLFFRLNCVSILSHKLKVRECERSAFWSVVKVELVFAFHDALKDRLVGIETNPFTRCLLLQKKPQPL
jgi:hypothetical protein